MHLKLACLLAALLLGRPCAAEQWFSVARPGGQAQGVAVEVDLDSVNHRGSGGEAVIRTSYGAPRAHAAGFSYRSFVGTAQFDCQQLSVSLASAAYFAQPAGQGQRLGADSAGREAGMPPGLLQSVPAPVRQALLRAICATARKS
jgi:hypothetical protein